MNVFFVYYMINNDMQQRVLSSDVNHMGVVNGGCVHQICVICCQYLIMINHK